MMVEEQGVKGRSPTGRATHEPSPAVSAVPVSVPNVELRVAIQRGLIATLGDTYDCNRVWSAWGVGTMDQDDFVPVLDRLEELIDAIVYEIDAIPAEWMGELTSEEQAMIDRAWDIHVAAGPKCELPPTGWACTRGAGHAGPCATIAQGMSAGTAKTAQPVEGEARQPGPQGCAQAPDLSTPSDNGEGE